MIDAEERVILVDENDQPLGLMDKLQAHVEGVLHRAFSVIVFNPKGEILLQQRAMHKYHSRGLWTNACCSHPREGEDMLAACHRRLIEEMGFDCPLKPVTVLHYQTPPLDTGLIENEMLHLVAGVTEQAAFDPSPDEVMGWRWISAADLEKEIVANPENYSYWFRIYLQRFDMKAIFKDCA
jgi:isopentenyl-diphosphate delta-isomerase